MHLTQVLKKIKEGTLEINEEDGEESADDDNQDLVVRRREEISSMQVFVKNTYY